MLLLTRRGKVAGRPAWDEITANSSGLIELLQHIEHVDGAVVDLGRAIDTVIPGRGPAGGAVPDHADVTQAYSAAADGLVELSSAKLGRDPSDVIARFVHLSRHLPDDPDTRSGSDLLLWLEAVGDALRSDRALLPATPPPGGPDLGVVVQELRRAVNAQLDALALALSRPRAVVPRRQRAALEQRTAEVRDLVQDADAVMARGEVRAALAALAAIALPTLPDGPSSGFAMASRAAAARLRRVSAGYDAAVARLVDHASDLIDHHVGALVDLVPAAMAEPGLLDHAR